jgi:hypothetical protein
MVKTTFNIDGRTRIAELDKFIGEVLARNSKYLGVFTLSVKEADLGSYQKLCDELTKDNRAGISNVSDTVQVYIIPPTLVTSIQILQDKELKHMEGMPKYGLLYGVAITKEAGPVSFTSRNYPVLPYGK